MKSHLKAAVPVVLGVLIAGVAMAYGKNLPVLGHAAQGYRS